jgi:hypothetical protein
MENHWAARAVSLSYSTVWSRTVIGGYFKVFYGVANLPKGFMTTSSLKCENNVEETLHGIFPYLMAFYFC